MNRWGKVFRVAVVLLLAVIAAQLGALESIGRAGRSAYYFARSFVVGTEEPAPPAPGSGTGMGALFERENMEAARDLIRDPTPQKPPPP